MERMNNDRHVDRYVRLTNRERFLIDKVDVVEDSDARGVIHFDDSEK